MNFFEPIPFFDPPMDNSPWSEGEFWSNLKSSNISETGEAMPTKIGLHIFHINLDMHEFFQLILFFDIHGPKGNLAFKKGHKSAKTGEAMRTKFDFHAFHVNLYLHEFLQLILFFYSPQSEGKFCPF